MVQVTVPLTQVTIMEDEVEVVCLEEGQMLPITGEPLLRGALVVVGLVLCQIQIMVESTQVLEVLEEAEGQARVGYGPIVVVI